MDEETLGMLLDQAVHIKDSSLITKDTNDRERLFWEDPTLLDEKESLERLDFWHKWMLEWTKEGVATNLHQRGVSHAEPIHTNAA